MTNEIGLREKIARVLFERGRGVHDAESWASCGDEMQQWLLGHADAVLALISPAGEVVVPVASPLERERFLSILGERLEAAFNAGAEWAQGFDSRREAHGVLDLLSPDPRGMEG